LKLDPETNVIIVIQKYIGINFIWSEWVLSTPEKFVNYCI